MFKRFILPVLLSAAFAVSLPLSHAQAAKVNVNALSQCMAKCKGNKSCVNSCVSRYKTRGMASDVLKCLAGCGMHVTAMESDATLKEKIHACCQGCLQSMD